MSRRRWRAIHRPPIRRGDPVIEFAEWSLPVASVIMLIASFGIAKRGPVPREISAIAVIGCAAVIVLVMFVLSIRLFVKRGILPFSRRAALALAGVSIISPLVLWARYEGTLAPLVITACLLNGLCLLAGGLAFLAGRRRSPRDSGVEVSESRLDDAAAGTSC
ncbi:hypothetical protein [Microbacterium sp. K27]|uniref:hypothetical protein n=2 Tax=Microbacterium TaxID=33882 RepID=UPI00109B823D|nr:hypothetical protein [Microbacterium sp. K27]